MIILAHLEEWLTGGRAETDRGARIGIWSRRYLWSQSEPWPIGGDLIPTRRAPVGSASPGSAGPRTVGTIGGNIANGSPIGDMPPPLIALGTDPARCSRKAATRDDAAGGLLHRLRQAGPQAGRIREMVSIAAARGPATGQIDAATRFPSASTRISPRSCGCLQPAHSWRRGASPRRAALPLAAWRRTPKRAAADGSLALGPACSEARTAADAAMPKP